MVSILFSFIFPLSFHFNLGLIELRRIEAAEDIATQLSKSRNIVYLPHGPQMLLNISAVGQ
jgi:hypothetical protein